MWPGMRKPKAKAGTTRKRIERAKAMRDVGRALASMTRKQIDAAQRKRDREIAPHVRACDRADRAMRRAWLKEHPGERPLPEHLCALDYPFPGYKRWCAAALKWIVVYN